MLAFTLSSDSPLSTFIVSFDSLKYFKKYAPDKFISANIKKGSNSVNTCNLVTVPTLCAISDAHLSVYQISFNSLLYCQRHAPDNLNIAKIRKGNNSIIPTIEFRCFSFCTST